MMRSEQTAYFSVFGDSVCFGQLISPHLSWVTRLASAIEAGAPGMGICVQNTSINGNTTRMALERIAFDVQAHNPAYAIVQFGMNDCNYWQTDRGLPRVSPAAFDANVREILDRILNVGAKHIFLNTNHPTPRTAPFSWANISYQQSNEKYNKIVRLVASDYDEKHLTLIDIERDWLARIEAGASLSHLLLSDGIHLSSSGHDAYFKLVTPQVLARLFGTGQRRGTRQPAHG